MEETIFKMVDDMMIKKMSVIKLKSNELFKMVMKK